MGCQREAQREVSHPTLEGVAVENPVHLDFLTLISRILVALPQLGLPGFLFVCSFLEANIELGSIVSFGAVHKKWDLKDYLFHVSFKSYHELLMIMLLRIL